MSGYGPVGWSTSLNMAYRLMRSAKGQPVQRMGGNRGLVLLGWFFLRMVLGIHQGLVFELLGAFILSQTGFTGYDYRTHRNAHAIVVIGTTGGIAMGLILIILDVLTARSYALADAEPEMAPRPGRPFRAIQLHAPNAITVRNQAALRILLWPALAAIGGAVGTMLYHLSQNSKPEPRAGDRAGTGAIVEIVGAAVAVSAPSLIQLLTLTSAGNKKP